MDERPSRGRRFSRKLVATVWSVLSVHGAGITRKLIVALLVAAGCSP
ncbi:MAG: hypothetical protein ACC742_09300 [Thermoanaerobaculales bacterium]